MIDHIELKRLAEAATQGQWSRGTRKFGGVVYGGPIQRWVNGSGQSQVAMTTGADWMRLGETEANADFIAAANPAAILDLLAEIERLKGGHGEPVAYADPKAFENFKNHAHKGGIWNHEWMWANSSAGLVPLYTSQPAPVSVVLPAEDDHQTDYGSYGEGHKHGWNDCLDKVKELNQ